MPSHLYRCQLCNATYVCRANNTDQLLRHANEAHPNVIGQFTIEDEIPEEGESKTKRPVCARWTLVLPTSVQSGTNRKGSNTRRKPSCNCVSTQTPSVTPTASATGLDGQAAGGDKPAEETSCADSGSYSYVGGSLAPETPTFWTTVETWRPGPSRIPCPNCGVVARPLVRRQKRRINSTLTGALCVLSCWPICFLPFMSGRGPLGRMELYCSSCDHFIAVFDPETETFMRPPTPSDDKKEEPSEGGKKPSDQNMELEGRGDE